MATRFRSHPRQPENRHHVIDLVTSPSSVEVRLVDVVSPAPRPEWGELIRGDKDAITDQGPTWLDAVREAGGFGDASRLYRFSDGRRFVLPMVSRAGRYGPRAGYLSGWGVAGLVGADLEPQVVSIVAADLQRSPAVLTHIRPNPLQGAAWQKACAAASEVIPRRAHILDIADGADATFARFGQSCRRSVRKAEKAGVEVTLYYGGDMIDVFHSALYMPSIDRWAERQREPKVLARLRAGRRDPLRKVQMIGNRLGREFRLYLASVDGVPAAGCVVLWGPHNAHYILGAMDYRVAKESAAAYAVQWAAIRDACSDGFRWYQMGESGQNASLSQFKQSFRAQPIDYAEYRIERLPLLAADRFVRSAAKRAIGFEDV